MARRKLLLPALIKSRPPEPLIHDFPEELAIAFGFNLNPVLPQED